MPLQAATSAELREPVGETAELYLEGGDAVYRLVHRSLSPLREAEYELRFRADPSLRRAAEEVEPVPAFQHSGGEPGLGKVLPHDPLLGIPFLERVRQLLLGARFPRRRRPPWWQRRVRRGEDVRERRLVGTGVLSRPARGGVLPDLVPRMGEMCRAFGRLYRAAPVGKTSVFFLVAEKP